MIDAVTVLRKELAELIGDRSSFRGVFIQTTLLIVVLGVAMPLGSLGAWLHGKPQAIALDVFLPSMVAATISADAFAGERERRTIETLLATPLSDRAIVLGKAGAALLVSVVVVVIGIALATVTVNLSLTMPHTFFPPAALWATAIAGSTGISAVVTALSIIVSMRVTVARSAQQVTSLLFGAVAGVAIATWINLHLPLTWRALGVGAAVSVAVGVASLLLASAQFDRGRFFEKR